MHKNNKPALLGLHKLEKKEKNVLTTGRTCVILCKSPRRAEEKNRTVRGIKDPDKER